MFHAWVEAAKTADPGAPELREYASGEALKLLTTDLYVSRDEGRVAVGEPVIKPVVADAKPTDVPVEVTLSDCVDDTNWLDHNKETGALWDDQPGGRSAVTAVVKKADGVWKVDSYVSKEQGTC